MTTSYVVFQAQSTPASPGLNIPTPGSPLPGIPPNLSIQAAISAGLLPANCQTATFGATSRNGGGVAGGASSGRTVLESIAVGDTNGTGLTTTNPFGWPCGGACGSNSVTGAAGGLNQTDGPSAGEASILIAAAPGTQAPNNGGMQPPSAISSPNITVPTQPVYQC
jgi:hypothetical protein